MEKNQTMREKMQRVASKIQSNKYMSSISNGLAATMPLLLGGAIFSLIDNINIPVYQNFLISTGLKTLTGIPASVTTNFIAIYAAFSIAYSLAVQFKKDGFPAGLMAIMSFFIVTPMGVMENKGMGISTAWLGAQGLFVAIILAVGVSRLYVLMIEKKFYIKMPKGVPPTIEKAFAAIAPAFVVILIMLFIRGTIASTPFGDIHKFIFYWVQLPLTKLGGSWWAYLICTAMMSILWFLGLHGPMVVGSVMTPIWATLRLENLAAFQSGTEIPNIIAGGSFLSVYTTVGGSGATIGLAIALVYARSKRYKTLGRLSIIPSLLGVNEPLMFGLPMVLNTRLLIPLVCAPLATTGLAIIATAVGILPKLRGVGIPTGTPVVINGFIEGGWRVAAFQIVLIVISFLIYYPFFKKADADALKLESSAESNA